MKISVIIPTFNRIDLLKRAIDSVLNQSIKPYDIIVVDDGSTDGTFSMIQQKYKSVKLFQQHNSGVSKARNNGIKLAEGDQNKVDSIKKIIDQNFDLSPRGIREMLKLNNPIYEITSAYGHFGRKPSNKGEFTWEKTDKADLFKL